MKTFLILLFLAPLFIFSARTAGSADGAGRVHSITLPRIAVQLKPGTGREKAETYCAICHSVDYITMQPNFPEKKWGEIVTKMIKAFGAPIPADTAREITAYLGTAYSTGK